MSFMIKAKAIDIKIIKKIKKAHAAYFGWSERDPAHSDINRRLLISFISLTFLLRYMTLIWFSMYFCRLASLDLLAASLFFCRFITYRWSGPPPHLLLGTVRRIFSKFLGGPRLSRYRCLNDTKSDCL